MLLSWPLRSRIMIIMIINMLIMIIMIINMLIMITMIINMLIMIIITWEAGGASPHCAQPSLRLPNRADPWKVFLFYCTVFFRRTLDSIRNSCDVCFLLQGILSEEHPWKVFFIAMFFIGRRSLKVFFLLLGILEDPWKVFLLKEDPCKVFIAMFFIESRSLQDLFYCNVFLLKADHCKVLFYWKKVLERFFIARMSLQRDADDFKNANGDDENEKQTRKA